MVHARNSPGRSNIWGRGVDGLAGPVTENWDVTMNCTKRNLDKFSNAWAGLTKLLWDAVTPYDERRRECHMVSITGTQRCPMEPRHIV